MKIFPNMSIEVTTKPVGREWLDEEVIDQLNQAPVLCKITYQQQDEQTKTRWFYDLIESPYVEDSLNKVISNLKTSVLYPNDQIETMVDRFGWGKKVEGRHCFCKFIRFDGKVATSMVTIPAGQQQSA